MQSMDTPEYAIDAHGIVHLVNPESGGEFTLCGVAFDNTEDDIKTLLNPEYGIQQAWLKVEERPVTCPSCIHDILVIRQAKIGKPTKKKGWHSI